MMSVRWELAGRQSLRDTLLIVIGTLIGIGVTVMIEAVKPYLEALEKSRARRDTAQALAESVASRPNEPPRNAPNAETDTS